MVIASLASQTPVSVPPGETANIRARRRGKLRHPLHLYRRSMALLRMYATATAVPPTYATPRKTA